MRVVVTHIRIGTDHIMSKIIRNKINQAEKIRNNPGKIKPRKRTKRKKKFQNTEKDKTQMIGTKIGKRCKIRKSGNNKRRTKKSNKTEYFSRNK